MTQSHSGIAEGLNNLILKTWPLTSVLTQCPHLMPSQRILHDSHFSFLQRLPPSNHGLMNQVGSPVAKTALFVELIQEKGKFSHSNLEHKGCTFQQVGKSSLALLVKKTQESSCAPIHWAVCVRVCVDGCVCEGG